MGQTIEELKDCYVYLFKKKIVCVMQLLSKKKDWVKKDGDFCKYLCLYGGQTPNDSWVWDKGSKYCLLAADEGKEDNFSIKVRKMTDKDRQTVVLQELLKDEKE